MFTAEIGIGVVVMIVFAAFWLAFMLWEDWGQAGKTARARASAKANGWEQDEMQNTITRNGAIIAYRLMTVGLFVVMLVDIIAFGKNVSEFAILWFVCMVFEGVYRTIATYRAAKTTRKIRRLKCARWGYCKAYFHSGRDIRGFDMEVLALKMRNNIKTLRKARACGRRTWQSMLGVSAADHRRRWRTISMTRTLEPGRIKPRRLLERPVEEIFSSSMKIVKIEN